MVQKLSNMALDVFCRTEILEVDRVAQGPVGCGLLEAAESEEKWWGLSGRAV
jgi:hypothetical protein